MTTRKPIPTRFPSSLARARALIRAGHTTAALSVLAGTLETAEQFDPAHALYLQTLLSLGMRKETLEALGVTLQVPLATADACDALAYLARQLDRHEQANTLYRKAAGLASESARLVQPRGKRPESRLSGERCEGLSTGPAMVWPR